jgi:hypothetical protein
MAAVTHNGTPDRYIDFKRDLWVEFKYAKTKGTDGYNVGEMLSAQQKVWMRRRFEAGQNAIVVVGIPAPRALGFVSVHPAEWEGTVPADVWRTRVIRASEIAAYILQRVS